MQENMLFGLAMVIMLGILAQWLAWRIKVASILLLLLFGITAGPITGVLDSDELFGDLLFPVVSFSVGVILFEGGLSLRFEDLRGHERAMWKVISLGAFVTWAVSATAAYLIFSVEVDMALLLGAILVVTGPTVVTPLLRQIRPAPRVASILRWEGILIDPIGAILAVLVFEEIVSGRPGSSLVIESLLTTMAVGLVFGIVGANVLVELFRRHWVPDHLHNPFTLMAVFGLFAASDLLQAESGLLTVTVMGVSMANQKRFDIDHIIEFKETLQVLLISGLFILLGSRLDLNSLTDLGVKPLIFVAVLMLVARPLSVWLSMLGTTLSWREKLFIAWLAPRGIVAAAVASIFSIELLAHDHQDAEILIPVTFSVIIITVIVYSLTAGLLARYLNLVEKNPQGVLMVGGHKWARQIASEIQKAGFRVLLADSNQANALAAQNSGLDIIYGNILSERVIEELDLSDIGHVLTLTSNDEVNALAAVQFKALFDHFKVYQIARQAGEDSQDAIAKQVGVFTLFGDDMTFEQLRVRFGAGDSIKAIHVLDAERFYEMGIQTMLPLFVVKNEAELYFWTAVEPPHIETGDSVVGLVKLTELDQFSSQEIVPIERVTQTMPVIVLNSED